MFLLILLFFIVAIIIISSKLEKEKQILHQEAASSVATAVYSNPGQGIFQCHANNAVGKSYIKGGGIIVHWGELQPYDSHSLDNNKVQSLIQEIKKNAGKKVYLHFEIYGGLDEVVMPSWLNVNDYDYLGKGIYPNNPPIEENDQIEIIYILDSWVSGSGGQANWISRPVPWGENYQRLLGNFLRLLNQEFEKEGVKNLIEYIEPAVGGKWGTTHLYDISDVEKTAWVNKAGCNAGNYKCFGQKFNEGINAIIDIYAESFSDIPLMVIGGSCFTPECNYNNETALEKYGLKVMFKMAGLGDLSATCGLRENYLSPMCGSNARTKCGQEPTGASIDSGSTFFDPAEGCHKNYYDIYKQSLKQERISYYCFYSADVKCSATQEANLYVANHLGAQIKLSSFNFKPSTSVQVNQPIAINFSWQNTGGTALIAPVKNNLKWTAGSYKLFLEFVRSDGTIAHYQEFDINPPTNNWQTTDLFYQTDSSINFNVPDVLGRATSQSQNTYKVYAGLTDPNGENKRFVLINSDSRNDTLNRRYLLTDSFEIVKGEVSPPIPTSPPPTGTPTPSSLPTSTPILPTPTLTLTLIPTPATSFRCDSHCSWGKWQCERDNEEKTGGSCQINPACPGVADDNYQSYWRWSYCYPIPTPTPTSINTCTCTSCPSDKPLKSQGNANCDEKIDLKDFILWLNVYRRIQTGESVSAEEKANVDFNCSPSDTQHIVDLQDFGVWLNGYRERV